MDNPGSDPRNFQADPPHDHDHEHGHNHAHVHTLNDPMQMLGLLLSELGPGRRQGTAEPGGTTRTARTRPESPSQGPGRSRTFRFAFSNGDPFGPDELDTVDGLLPSSRSASQDRDRTPLGSTHNPNMPGGTGPNDNRQRQFQAMLHHHLMSVFGTPGFVLATPGAHGAMGGQFGDYVFNNEALDQIITQLMDSNSHRPVPAPEETINALPRAKVAAGSELVNKQCAVCTDNFEVSQEVITLPCTHPYHDECILPWIRTNGTCPVCRHALVPQPEPHATPTAADYAAAGAPFNPRDNARSSQGPHRGSRRGPSGSQFPGAWDELD